MTTSLRSLQTSAHPVQAVHTGLPVQTRVCTELLAEGHLPG